MDIWLGRQAKPLAVLFFDALPQEVNDLAGKRDAAIRRTFQTVLSA